MTHPYHDHARAQALDALPFGTTDGLTLPGRLARLYRWCGQHGRPCTWSVAELAERFAGGDERQIQRAHVLIRRTYGRRFVEVGQWYGPAQLSVRRWIEPHLSNQSSRGVPADLLISTDQVDRVDLRARRSERLSRATPSTRLESRSHRANADPARVRTRAPVGSSAGSRARERRRAVRLELEQPDVMRLAPHVRIEAGLRAALDGRHGPGTAARIERLMSEPASRQRPREALLAARTLAERAADVPGKLWRHLFREACGGDTLCDRGADRAATRAAELELLTGPADAPRDEQAERLEQLEQRLTAVRLGGDTDRADELAEAIAIVRARLEPAEPPDPQRDRMLEHLREIEQRQIERDRREARGPPPTAPDDPVARARGYALLPAELRLEIPEYAAVAALVAWFRT